MIKIYDHVVEPTIFPDGTSQVWKLPDEVIAKVRDNCEATIEWEFGGDSEVFYVCQLAELLNALGRNIYVEVKADFLPYGRQDKPVSNDATFALTTLLNVLDISGVDEVITTDAHPPAWDLPPICNSHSPEEHIRDAVDAVKADAICYPDSGARQRYAKLDLENQTPKPRIQPRPRLKYPRLSKIILEKVRDQATGEITGLAFKLRADMDIKSILIVDDICDGGRTFIESAKLLKAEYPDADIHLYVSHGIFSKGTDVLFDAGIKTIHTIKGEVKRA